MRLLRALVQAGVLVDASHAERVEQLRRCSTAVVIGRGPLTVGVAVGLLRAQVGTVHAATGGTVLSGDLGTGLHDADVGLGRMSALRAAVARLVPDRTISPPPQRLVPDLVVLADETPDPVLLGELLGQRTTHLCTRLRDGVGIVGPLVLPGRSACLGCLELHRTARERSWPVVSAQLIGRRGSAEQACVVATAALATAQAIAALEGATGRAGVPPTLDATLELDVGAGRMLRRSWPAVPGCRCGAAAASDPEGAGGAAVAEANEHESSTRGHNQGVNLQGGRERAGVVVS